MIFASKVPLIFWPEAFLTAVHLINRLPSSIRNFQSPFYLLHNQHPDYSSRRVFGSRCFPLIHNAQQNKFDPKSLPCIFLGYSDRYKGYKCLFPPSGRIFISPSVIFYERFFPFKDKNPTHTSDSFSLTTFQQFSLGPHHPPVSTLRHSSRTETDPSLLTPPIFMPPTAHDFYNSNLPSSPHPRDSTSIHTQDSTLYPTPHDPTNPHTSHRHTNLMHSLPTPPTYAPDSSHLTSYNTSPSPCPPNHLISAPATHHLLSLAHNHHPTSSMRPTIPTRCKPVAKMGFLVPTTNISSIVTPSQKSLRVLRLLYVIQAGRKLWKRNSKPFMIRTPSSWFLVL